MNYRVILITAISVKVAESAILNRYLPVSTQSEQMIYDEYLNKEIGITKTKHVFRGNNNQNGESKIELLSSYNADLHTKQIAKQAILKHFTSSWRTSGYESQFICNEMEKHLSGFWMVAIFDGGYDVAYTIIRRSPRYLVFAVKEFNILIAQEGNNQISNQKNDSPLL